VSERDEEKILFSLSHLPDILARRAWLPHIFLKRRKMSEGAVGRDLSCKLRRGGIVGGGRALLGETGEYIKTQGIVNSSRDYTAVDDSRRE
jgi:hypothetical protein